jgi:hypothetical protein
MRVSIATENNCKMAATFILAVFSLFNSILSINRGRKRRRKRRRIFLQRTQRLRRLELIRKCENYRLRLRRAQQNRRKVALLLCVSLSKKTCVRTTWVKTRISDIWEDVETTWTPIDWIENVRMSQQTFMNICDMIRPHIEKALTKFRPAIPVEKRVMIALWKLATNIEFRSLAMLFNVGRSTACIIFHAVVKSINDVLGPKYIKFPTGNSLRRVVHGFRSRWGFPQCAGAIDATHIPIIAPHEHHADYFNRKS